MIKSLLFVLLVLQVFSEERKVRLNYLDEIVLPALESGEVNGDVTVKLKSLPGNDDTVPITV